MSLHPDRSWHGEERESGVSHPLCVLGVVDKEAVVIVHESIDDNCVHRVGDSVIHCKDKGCRERSLWLLRPYTSEQRKSLLSSSEYKYFYMLGGWR